MSDDLSYSNSEEESEIKFHYVLRTSLIPRRLFYKQRTRVGRKQKRLSCDSDGRSRLASRSQSKSFENHSSSTPHVHCSRAAQKLDSSLTKARSREANHASTQLFEMNHLQEEFN
ncbi:unnamed protein product, partial [Didymodactylos carnosus]